MATRTSDLVLPIQVIAPQDATGGATNGTYVDVSGSENFAVVIQTGVIASAADDMDVTLTQATDSSGTGAKALAFTEAYTATSSGKTAETVTSSTITITASDDSKTYVIPLRQQQLDADNDFTHFRVNISSPGANSALVGAVVELAGQRYNKSV